MGARRIKKGEKGEATKYISRNKAIRKLQLGLHDFRRLCILKGIYPREPKHRKRVQKGNSQYKTQYYMKDVQFLSHEPLIWKFREHKAYMKKIRKSVASRNNVKYETLKKHEPQYKIDHLVRERYPTFLDALRDIDDPLTLCFLFARLAKTPRLNEMMIHSCRRLTIEFMHYVIEAKALRKVFISIKGYYYQAEIVGQLITWIVPHPFRPQNASSVDFNIMKLFTEFYICLLGFVNFRLYQTLNLHYPPNLTDEERVDKDEEKDETVLEQMLVSDRIASLNTKLKRTKDMEEDEGETMDIHLLEESVQNVKDALVEEEKLNKLKSLFKNLKFFLGRETNMESLTFVIRSFGGQVSWDATVAEGSTYQETDETVTHQIVDRPKVERTYLSRYYVQPQWVYDCVNARMFLPIQDYFPGVALPPHLSPFNIESDLYVPPEKEKLEAMQKGDIPVHAFPQEENSEEEEEESEGENEGEEEEEKVEEEKKTEAEKPQEGPEDDEMDPEKAAALEKMKVKRGQHVLVSENPSWKEEQEQYKLSVSMIPRKKKKIYRKLKRKENRQFVKAELLKQKRSKIEEVKAQRANKEKRKKAQQQRQMIKEKTKK